MDRAVQIVKDKGLTCHDRGALLVDLTEYKMDRAIVLKAGQLSSPCRVYKIAESVHRWDDDLLDSRSGWCTRQVGKIPL
jgi:hypothetical protein